MKHFAIAVLAVITLSALTSAKSLAVATGGTPPPLPPPPDFQAMEKTHAQIEQIHQQARVAMLNALQPEHRNLLAQVVGQLVLAPKPDTSAAAKTLDAALTADESKAIVGAWSSAEQQMHQVMESMHKQMEHEHPSEAHAGPGGPEGPPTMVRFGNEQMQNDPGALLLIAAAGAIASPQSMGVYINRTEIKHH